MNNKEIRKAIEKYQVEHPLQFGIMLDVTSISSKEGADIVSQTIEKISKKVNEDTELWCICEMAKMYMQGIKPIYLERLTGEWITKEHSIEYYCSHCGERLDQCCENFCCHCGADMRGEKE